MPSKQNLLISIVAQFEAKGFLRLNNCKIIEIILLILYIISNTLIFIYIYTYIFI